MTTFEMLAKIADGQGPAWDHARAMIGGPETLGLLLAKAALAQTTESLSVPTVAKALAMSESGARKKIDNLAFKH